MGAALAEDENETPQIRPEHLRVVALRLQGKRWSEIAVDLGVRRETVWEWRRDNPEIDELIRQESADLIESVKAGLTALGPEAVVTLGEEMRLPSEEGGTRLTAAKYVLEQLKTAAQPNDRRGPISHEERSRTQESRDELIAKAREWRRQQLGRGK